MYRRTLADGKFVAREIRFVRREAKISVRIIA